MNLPNHHREAIERTSINPLDPKFLPWRTLSRILDAVDPVLVRLPLSQLWHSPRQPRPIAMDHGLGQASTTVMQDLRSIGWRGKYLDTPIQAWSVMLTGADLWTIKDIMAAKLLGESQVDDKTMIMERTIQMVATLPDHSSRQELLTNMFINKLWNSLDHPPLLYMGDQFRYRQPDGSNNNPLFPKLGAAGTPYARSVKPGKANLGALPDPEAVYEAVMARDVFKKNANNVSSILWYWATIIIHDLFRTNIKDPNINDASSYLDLSPLYGSSKEAIDSVRTFKDGLLKADTFADKRLIGNPPGVCIILIMFNRFHNYIAGNLAAINEGNRFPKPPPHASAEEAAAAWERYDEELFQTARLITSGLYINITLIDYVRNIINLNRTDSRWTLDPRQEMGVSAGSPEGAESGVGSAVSAEFNLCYRWHSCLSEMDDKWIQDFYKDLLGKDFDAEMDICTLIGAVKQFEASIPKDPAQRTFGGFARGPEGRFDDDELASCIATAIEQPGGSFGAQNVPRIMKPVEMLGIIRGRKWNLAGLNEFRKHFGLKAYQTFEDINSDPVVANALRDLYGHPDHVELYPGTVAEEAKTPLVPGVGITPTYTISRVVLSDAVSLVRGDRYYTTDYHPGYLTQWGYNEVNYDLDVNHGCSFYKLFIRAFPRHFQQDSVYAHYPMVIPSENHKILTDLGRVDQFSFTRPQLTAPLLNIWSEAGVKHILLNHEKYRVNWQQGLSSIVGRKTGPSKEHLQRMLLDNDDWIDAAQAFCAAMAEQLLADKSYKIAGQRYCDVVRHVGNLAYTHFAARLLGIPLRSEANPGGVLSDQELYAALATIATAVSVDVDPVKSFPLRRKAKQLAMQLGGIIEASVKAAASGRPKDDPLAAYGRGLVRALSKAGLKPGDIAWDQVLPTAAAMVPSEAQLFAQAVDFYLSPSGQPHLDEIHLLASQVPGPETDSLLLGYALEGIRLGGPSGLFLEAAVADVLPEDGQVRKIKAGDGMFVSLAGIARDSATFPSPDMLNPRRPLESYIASGTEHHARLGRVALLELFRALFRHKCVRRAAGPQGELKSVPGPGGYGVFMTDDWGGVKPFPTAMKVVWDGE